MDPVPERLPSARSALIRSTKSLNRDIAGMISVRTEPRFDLSLVHRGSPQNFAAALRFRPQGGENGGKLSVSRFTSRLTETRLTDSIG